MLKGKKKERKEREGIMNETPHQAYYCYDHSFLNGISYFTKIFLFILYFLSTLYFIHFTILAAILATILA